MERAQRKGAPTSAWSQQTALIHAETAVRAVQTNLATERSFLQRSLRDTPPGKDPSVDAMRKRLENLIDLQQALANRVTFQEGDVPPVDNRCIRPLSFAITTCGAAKLLTKADAMAEAGGGGLHVASFENPDETNLGSTDVDVKDVVQYGSPIDVKRALTHQEDDFAKATVAAANTCGI